MKILHRAMLILILHSGVMFGADSTNSEILLQLHERLTSNVLKNFKENADALRIMQTPDRALKTKLWLQSLNQIDRTRDLNFDFKDPKNSYSANIAPPHFGDSGADPASIKDPENRRIYEEAIQKNHEKALRSGFELQLKRLDDDSTTSAIKYFNAAYAKTPSDAKELIGYLNILTDVNHKAQMEERLREFIELVKK